MTVRSGQCRLEFNSRAALSLKNMQGRNGPPRRLDRISDRISDKQNPHPIAAFMVPSATPTLFRSQGFSLPEQLNRLSS
jgi:hypothetical protein